MGLISEVSQRPDLGVAKVDYNLEGSTLVIINPLNVVDDDSYFMEECGELIDGLQLSVLSPPVYAYITSLRNQRNLANDPSKYAGQTIQLGGPPARYPWKHPVKVVQTVATVEANVGQAGRRVLANLAETHLFNALKVNQEDWINVHCVVGASPLGGGSDYSDSQRKAGGPLIAHLSLCLFVIVYWRQLRRKRDRRTCFQSSCHQTRRPHAQAKKDD
jgi:hypothetical protein